MAAEKPGDLCTLFEDCPQVQPELKSLGIVPGGEFADCDGGEDTSFEDCPQVQPGLKSLGIVQGGEFADCDDCEDTPPYYPSVGDMQCGDGSLHAAFARIPEELLCTDN